MLDSIQQKLQSLEDNIAASKHTNAELQLRLRGLQVCASAIAFGVFSLTAAPRKRKHFSSRTWIR